MRKCSWCGKEYEATATHCVLDGTALDDPNAPPPLPIEEASPEPPLPVAEIANSSVTNASAAGFWTDRRVRIFEVALVCVIAFGSSILSSTFIFLGSSSGGLG